MSNRLVMNMNLNIHKNYKQQPMPIKSESAKSLTMISVPNKSMSFLRNTQRSFALLDFGKGVGCACGK